MALALDEEQQRILDSGIKFFDLREYSNCAPQASATQLVGGENPEKIWNFFIGKGLTPITTAAVMGNIEQESGYNPQRVQGTATPDGDQPNITVDGKTGYGLVQWTSAGRQQALADFAAEKGLPSGDLGVQLEWIFIEAGGLWDALSAMSDIREATLYFHDEYERSADGAEGKEERVQSAINALSTFGSSTGATSATSTTVTCGTTTSGAGGAVVGGYSLPLDRHWYDEFPDKFTGPHHDYPAVDIGIPMGEPVYSMTAGTVILAPNGTATEGCGFGLEIEAPNGVRYIYCHGSDGGSVDGARTGDQVQAGQLIMHSASTGSSTGPHLHIEIRISGVDHCPQPLLVSIAEGNPVDVFSLPTSGCSY